MLHLFGKFSWHNIYHLIPCENSWRDCKGKKPVLETNKNPSTLFQGQHWLDINIHYPREKGAWTEKMKWLERKKVKTSILQKTPLISFCRIILEGGISNSLTKTEYYDWNHCNLNSNFIISLDVLFFIRQRCKNPLKHISKAI